MSVSGVGRTPSLTTGAVVPMLTRGSSGPQVLALQKALLAAGFNPQGLDGSFGPKTEAALLAFQRSKGITVDGKAGPQTWNALRSGATTSPAPASSAGTLKEGSRGPEVMKLQRALIAAGFNPHGADGWFGPKTRAAVEAFQRTRGLEVDGKVGPKTWAALQGAQSSFEPAPSGSPSQTAPTAPTGGTSGAPAAGISGMLDWAKSMLGTPYAAVNPFRFGDVLWDGKPHQSVNGSGTVWNYPKGTRVFDCSGFVVAAFRKLGVDLMAHGIGSSSTIHGNTTFLQPLSREQLRPGDLITYNASNGVGHVVIYLGDNKTIESSGSKGVTYGTVDWDRARSFRRVPLP